MTGPAAPLDLDDALQRILDEVPAPVASERVDVERALGRVAAADCLAATDLPPFPASAMDGYAFRWRSDLGGLRIVGASLAGHPFTGAVGAAEAVRITTGAALPADCDTVAMQEDCAVAQGVVRIESPTRRADNVRQKAHDLRRGAILVERGRRPRSYMRPPMPTGGKQRATRSGIQAGARAHPGGRTNPDQGRAAAPGAAPDPFDPASPAA